MPYGSLEGQDLVTTVIQKLFSPGGENESTFNGFRKLKSQKWIRSGTNSSSIRQAPVCKPWSGPMKLVVKELPLGPRLAVKVFNKKANRFVWARKPIKVFKLVPDRSKVHVAKGMDLMPNALRFQSVNAVPMPNCSRETAGFYVNDPLYYRVTTGDLWESFSPLGSYTPLPFSPNTLFGFTDGRLNESLDSLDKQSITKLYNKVKSQDVNLLNLIAERRSTFNLLITLVKRLIKVLLAVKRGNLVKAFEELFPIFSPKAISSEWLQLQYGVLPLISDINGLIDHYNGLFEDYQFDVKVSASKSLERVFNSFETKDNISAVCSREISGKVKVTYKVRLRSSNATRRNLTKLGLTNLAATIYEQIPFSFVLDWALPLGDYLNDMDAFDGLQVVWCTKTTSLQENVIYTRQIGGLDNNNYNWTPAETTFVTQKFDIQRSVLTSVPKLRFPSVKSPVSTGHAINGIALLVQLSKGK